MQGFFDELVARDFSAENLKSNDDANVCYRDCVELSILALSKQPAVTERLLISLCEAYDDCNREYYGARVDNLLDKVDSIVARHSKENADRNQVLYSALSQKLSDDDKANINQIFSATVNAIVKDVRNAIIDTAAEISGEPVEADILTGTNISKE